MAQLHTEIMGISDCTDVNFAVVVGLKSRLSIGSVSDVNFLKCLAVKCVNGEQVKAFLLVARGGVEPPSAIWRI